MNKYTVKNHNGEIIYEGYSAFECLQKREREIATGDLCTVEVERSQDELSKLLNVDLYTETAKLALEHEHIYSFTIGSVIRSKKTGKLWSVIGLSFSCVQITKRDGVLYAPQLKVTCQDGTTTDMYDQLMQDNFELVDLSATQCDRKTFKGLRNLIGLHCVVDGVLANKAHKCYQFKAAPHNLIKPLLCTSIKTGKLMLDDTFKIDHKNRTALIFGRVTPLFNFKGRKA